MKKDKILEIARSHIKDIHSVYEKYLKEECGVKVSPIDILVRVNGDIGYSRIRRLLIKENEVIINFRIPEEALELYD